MRGEEYAHSCADVLAALEVNEQGLDDYQAEDRRKKFGSNELAQAKRIFWFTSLLNQCKNFIIYILLAAGIISFIKGHMIEVYVIMSIVLFITGLGFFMEYRAARDMEALRKLTPRLCRVIRNGTERQIKSADVVPGDIIKLSRGDIVPADARVLSAAHLHVNESMLTGESAEVIKSHEAIKSASSLAERSNMVFGGTHVTNGHGLAVIVSTGKQTEMGRIAAMLENVHEQDSPLQRRIDKLGKQISIIVLVTCLLIFTVMMIRGSTWDAALIMAIAVAVSGVPESLPAVIGIALALGIKRMIAQNAIVKQLSAVETLGTCTVICTDKTGTLTRNEMVVEHIALVDREIAVSGVGLNPEGELLHEGKPVRAHQQADITKLLEIANLCNNAALEQTDGTWSIIGEATEGALIVMSRKAQLKDQHIQSFTRIHELAFDPVRKCMSTVDRFKGKRYVHVKGAPEIVIGKSNYYLQDGKTKRLTRVIRQQLNDQNHQYASQGLRVLALAYKQYAGKSFTPHELESDLVFVGLVAIRDPPAPGVKEAIATCHEAGVKVIMITGDNPITAAAIARELNISTENDRLITGQELDNMSNEELITIIGHVSVFARTTPAHKLRIVDLLQKKGNIVAMTGDGVNDAPALKQADIGIALGKRGTEVAKEAAKMVITDDNFTTIANAVREGRIIYTNIRKFIYYLLGIGFSELMIVTIAAAMGFLPPITPLMILFINLVTSDILAMAIIKESPSPWIMRQKPRDPRETILSDYLLLRITQVVPIITLGTISLFLWVLWTNDGNLAYAQTVALATLILFEIFHAFNARSFVRSNFSREIAGNAILAGTLLLTVGTLMCVVYWPPAQAVFGTMPIRIEDWLKIMIMAPLVLIVVESQKAITQSEFKERERLATKA